MTYEAQQHRIFSIASSQLLELLTSCYIYTLSSLREEIIEISHYSFCPRLRHQFLKIENEQIGHGKKLKFEKH